MPPSRLVIFDCDSTLSTIEGIDELAALRPESIRQAIVTATHDAMEGRLPIEDVFGKRLDLIQPTQTEVHRIAQRYLETLVPNAAATLSGLHARQWTPVILSGGLLPAILPLARHLGIEQVAAVDIYFDAHGHYRDFDRLFPTTRSGGKPAYIANLRKQMTISGPIVMIGDGVSDLETRSTVDAFIGYGGVVIREKVRAEADHFLLDLADLPPLLDKLFS